jgi:hypothetical protein
MKVVPPSVYTLIGHGSISDILTSF